MCSDFGSVGDLVYKLTVLTLFADFKVRSKVLGSRGAILSLIERGVEIVWNLGFYWVTLSYDSLVGRDEEVVPYRARQLRNLLCDLGPSFIKAGQVVEPLVLKFLCWLLCCDLF